MSETKFVSLEVHVQGCGPCQARLEWLASEDVRVEAAEPLRPPELSVPPSVPGFVIEHELGRGGMGVVYRAWQPNLARHVAIKFLKGRAAAHTQERDRWLKEAQSLSRVRNRGIVQIFEMGEAEGRLYLVLELTRGGSLKDRLTRPLAPRLAARLAESMANAVEEIHKAGLLHLDLKPSNILLDGPPDGPWETMQPLIADFGIARLQNDAETGQGSSTVCGTPSYMAPEQIVGEPDRGEQAVAEQGGAERTAARAAKRARAGADRAGRRHLRHRRHALPVFDRATAVSGGDGPRGAGPGLPARAGRSAKPQS